MGTKNYFHLWLVMLLAAMHPTVTLGQEERKMLRLFMDNDFFAFQKEDGAYTNGLRIDFFSEGKSKLHSVGSKLYFSAGSASIISRSWSVMQVMITSNDITKSEPLPGDYPYSGTLFFSRSTNSMNPQRKFSIQTDYVAGIMGPLALAGETQDSFHRLIDHNRPKGWQHQFSNTFLFNINVSAKKFVAAPFRNSEIVASSQLSMGSMNNGVSLGAVFRWGRILPFFNSYVQQFITPDEKTWQLYVFIKPETSLVIHNVLLEGTLRKPDPANLYGHTTLPQVAIRNVIFSGDMGALFSYRRFAISLTYKTTTGLILNQPNKALGNVSLYADL